MAGIYSIVQSNTLAKDVQLRWRYNFESRMKEGIWARLWSIAETG